MDLIRHRLRQLLSFTLGIMRYPFTSSKYSIKRGYRHRKKYAHFSAKGAKDEMQNEVYKIAENIARENNLTQIIDVGCGSGYKLMKFFKQNYQVIGIDIQTTYDYLMSQYPDQTWVNGETVDFSSLTADVVICADVIEHVVNPDELVENIKKIKNLKYVVLSTPDRLLVRGWHDFGPPKNVTHVREWSGKEFSKYIGPKLNIVSQQVTHYDHGTLVLVCKMPQ